jgi:hypothetical protein
MQVMNNKEKIYLYMQIINNLFEITVMIKMINKNNNKYWSVTEDQKPN